MTEIRHREAGNLIGLLDERLLILVRDAPLTSGALDVVERELVATLAGARDRVACLVVVTATAGMSDAPLLARQRRMLRHAGAAEDSVSLALVTLGESVQAAMIRSFIRVASLGRHNLRIASEVGEAADWLGPRVNLPPRAIREAAEAMLRELAR